jgi:hypothetical protein
VRDAGVRDEALAAVQDVRVAVAPGRRPHGGAVGARPRLGERIGGEPLARGEPRQEALLLLLGAGQLDPERAELLHGDDQTARRAHLRDLLDHHERHQRALADPAVRLVEEDAEQLVLAEELDDVPRELGRLVDLRRAGRDPLGRERADELADLALLVVEGIPCAHRRRSLGGPNRLFDLLRGPTGILVLPHSDDCPTRPGEQLVRLTVASPIRLDLVPPPGGVRLRPGAVSRTPMPEAAVDEYRNAGASEGDVGSPSTSDRKVGPEPEPVTMEDRSESQLRPGVTATRLLHPATDGLRRRDGTAGIHSRGVSQILEKVASY